MFEQLKVVLCDHWGKDRDVAHAAWASTYDAEKLSQKSDADVRRVVSDVVTLNHGTPKERVWLDFMITCPIFIERQFDKYRMTVQFQDLYVEFYMAPMGRESITQNELSGRYRTIPDRALDLPLDVADIINISVQGMLPDNGDAVSSFSIQQDFEDELARQREFYEETLRALKHGRDEAKTITPAQFKRAREVVRGVLGTAFLTDMRILCNLSAFEWIVTQRIEPAAQLESRVIAARMLQEALKLPDITVAVQQMVETNGWNVYLEELAPVL